MQWIKDKLIDLECAFREYPRLFWLTMFYLVLTIITLFCYPRLLAALDGFNLMGTYPLHLMIVENIELLSWGGIVIPMAILFWGYFDILELYEKLQRRRYRY